MTKDIIHLRTDSKNNFEIEAEVHLSILPFLKFVEEKTRSENKYIADFFLGIYNKLKRYDRIEENITIDYLYENSEILELIHACVSNYKMNPESEALAFSAPFESRVFYYTDRWKDILIDPVTKEIRKEIKVNIDLERSYNNNIFIYKIILERFYGLNNYYPNNTFTYKIEDSESQIERYYRAELNTDFLEIIPKSELPQISIDLANERKLGSDVYLEIEKLIPLKNFSFIGFNIVKIVDVTIEESLRLIEQDVFDNNKEIVNHSITRNIQNILGSRDIEISYFPIIRLNDKIVLENNITGTESLFVKNFSSSAKANEHLNAFEWFIESPQPLFIKNFTLDILQKYPMLEFIISENIASYALIPISFSKKVIGILELYSRKVHILNENRLSILERTIPTLTYLMRSLSDNFNNQIIEIIRSRYTALQPVVQWKFNEAALKYLVWQKNNKESKFNDLIRFKNVYPIYTSIDIKDSTINRNEAIQKDLKLHFTRLLKCFQQIKKLVNLDIVENFVFQAENFAKQIQDRNELSNISEINEFLNNDVTAFLIHIKRNLPETENIIQDYFNAIDSKKGDVYFHRNKLEFAIKSINDHLENSIKLLMTDIYDQYPFYFEKFRTDGIEYDIYIGQSLNPQKPFSNLYLKNLRLWQLISTTVLAKQTQVLMKELSPKLDITSLILVYDTPIDIAFRNDERRFDIDGTFNIRYEMIKKRIDKVLIKNTNERLTQPNKLSIVYFNSKNETEYTYYINFLIEKGLLENEIEKYDLEDLQGLSGLKAFRLSIKYE